MSAGKSTWEQQRRQQLETRTVPFLGVAQGMVAVDLKGRYTPLMAHESAMDGELVLLCPDGRWTVEDLERALDRTYEAAVSRHSGVKS